MCRERVRPRQGDSPAPGRWRSTTLSGLGSRRRVGRQPVHTAPEPSRSPHVRAWRRRVAGRSAASVDWRVTHLGVLRARCRGTAASAPSQEALPKNKGGRPKVDFITLTKAARARFDTLAAESIEAVFQAVLTAATQDGDMAAARLLVDRVIPSRRGAPVSFHIRPLKTPDDCASAYADLLDDVGAGRSRRTRRRPSQPLSPSAPSCSPRSSWWPRLKP